VISSITTSASASPAGCPATTNVVIQQSNVGNATGPQTVTVPANKNLTLPAAFAPTIRLLDTGSNQDACKNGSFRLSYLTRGTK
jgi:hypothetical protein